MTINEPGRIGLGRHNEVFKDQFIGKTVSLIAPSRQRVKQSALIDNMFLTAHKRGVHLLANKTTAESTPIAPMIPVLSLYSDSRVTTLAKTVPHLQLINISPHTAKRVSVETCRVPPKIFEYKEW